MPILRTGRDAIAGILVATAGALTRRYDSTGATLWVSSSTEVHSAASTWFGVAGAVGTTMEATYPLRAANVLQFQGVYSTAQANFQWESWLIHNATQSDSGSPLNMAVAQVLGVKVNSQRWTFTACWTLTT